MNIEAWCPLVARRLYSSTDMPKIAPRAGVRRALDQKQLVLFYQPIHELESRKIVAAEALLRARRSSGEIRSGAPIAAGAEQGSEMFRLDSWTMQRACGDAAGWGGVRLNVNLSPREFEEGAMSARLKKIADCSRLNLEITETSYIKKPEEIRSVLDELRALGVQLWLDDFGTGYSSLSHLLHFDLDGLKVPSAFIKGVQSNPRSRAITKSIIGVAHDLGLQVIAEGVENEEQLAFLRDLHCEYVQGFLFSHPMALEELRDVLQSL